MVNPQNVETTEQQTEKVNQVVDADSQATLAQPQTAADKMAAGRDDVGDNTQLPAEVTDQLLDGADQVFLAAFKNSQTDGFSREGALQVAWNSVKQGFQQSGDGSWRRKTKPDDNMVGSGTEGSAS